MGERLPATSAINCEMHVQGLGFRGLGFMFLSSTVEGAHFIAKVRKRARRAKAHEHDEEQPAYRDATKSYFSFWSSARTWGSQGPGPEATNVAAGLMIYLSTSDSRWGV